MLLTKAENLNELTWRLSNCEESLEQLGHDCVSLFCAASSVVILGCQHDWQELTSSERQGRLQLGHCPGIVAAPKADIWELNCNVGLQVFLGDAKLLRGLSPLSPARLALPRLWKLLGEAMGAALPGAVALARDDMITW